MEESSADYRKMYLTLLHATEQAMELLIAAQQECEEIYIETAPEAPAEAWPPAREKNIPHHAHGPSTKEEYHHG